MTLCWMKTTSHQTGSDFTLVSVHDTDHHDLAYNKHWLLHWLLPVASGGGLMDGSGRSIKVRQFLMLLAIIYCRYMYKYGCTFREGVQEEQWLCQRFLRSSLYALNDLFYCTAVV